MSGTLAPPRVALLSRIGERIRRQLRGHLLWEHCYAGLREPKRRGPIAPTAADDEKFAAALAARSVTVERLRVDVEDFRRWLQRAQPIYRAHRYNGPCFAEKALEHYVAARLLCLTDSKVYLDVASAGSPAPDIYAALYGGNVFRQDLAYPHGINGRVIGGDAAALPLEDASLDAMALHCSFEHFEGDADSRFISEAARVLRPGGKLCIVPLYLAPEYSVQTDPAVWPAGGIEFEPDTIVYCDAGYGNRHGRFYSVEKFLGRVMAHSKQLRATLLFVENAQEVDATCYLRFVALFEQPERLA